jgi:predicted component of type VI protein secretion system
VEARLVVVGGDAQSRQFELRLPAVIGRSRSTDVRLGHPLVSRHHCEVFEADGILMVRDLGSLNGTFVGNTRIAEQAIPIQPGEVFTVGPVSLRAEYAGAASVPGRSSTWETQGATYDDPLPEGPAANEPPANGPLSNGPLSNGLSSHGNGHSSNGHGHAHNEQHDTPDEPLVRDDDEETARPSE